MRKYNRKAAFLTNEQENRRLPLLDLESRTVTIRNERGKRFRWYGARLILLIKFYDKTVKEVAKAVRANPSTVRSWCSNLRKPSDLNINRLSFLFEIEKEFFTAKYVKMVITEQSTVKYEKANNAKGSEKAYS